MEEHDAVIMISPYVGKYYNGQSFLTSLEVDEISFMIKEYTIGYKKTHPSYLECLKDLKDKLGKIKQILNQGESNDSQEENVV